MKKKIIVIGAGIGGLATAALCAKDGFEVTVLEKNAFIGGRASIYQEKGFTFDKGPSWYMMPEVFDEYFALFNKKTKDFYELRRLPVHYKVYFDGKRTYEIASDIKKNISLFDNTSPGAGTALKKYLKQARSIYDLSMNGLVKLDYESYRPLINIEILKNIRAFNFHKNLHSYVAGFFTHKELQKILEFTTVFLGGSPYNTPAFYSLVAHADFNLGIYYPIGGIHKVVEALTILCNEQGVRIKKNSEVIRVETTLDRATAVYTKNTSYNCDAVIINADYHHAETQLLSPKQQTYSRAYWEKKTLSPSAFIIYVGINKKLTSPSHHNLYFNDSWEEHFSRVYKSHEWPDNPSYYVHIPSKTDYSIAPKSCDTLMFLVPVAPGLKDTNSLRASFSKKIITHFESLIGEEISQHIVVQKIFSHKNFMEEYNSYKGSAFGIAHTLLQTAIFRPRNHSKKIANVYYVGQYTNPGVGMPPCLLSAHIVSNLIKKHEYEN